MTVSRRVFSGATYLFLGQGGARLLAILTVPILSHLLAPEGYGTAALVTTAISLGAVFGLSGIDVSYARFLGAREAPSGPPVETFCWRFGIGSGILWGLITAFVWMQILPLWMEVPSGYGILVGGGVALATAHALAQARARLGGQFQRLAIVLFGSALLGSCTAVALAWSGIHDERPLIVAMLATIVLGLIGLGAPALSHLRHRSGLSSAERSHIVRVGLAGVVTAPVYWLLSSSDRWFLTALAGTEVAGIYAVSASIGVAGLVVSNAVFAAWLPEALKEYERDPEEATRHLTILQRRILIVLITVWLIVSGIGEETLYLLAAPPFHGGAPAIPWLAGGVFFYGFFHLANAGLLIRKRTSRVIGWWIAGGLLSVALNIMLIPNFGGVGAAMAQCFAFAFVGVGSLVSSRAALRLPLGWRLCIGLGMVGLLGYPLIGIWGDSPILSIVFKVPVILGVMVCLARFVEPQLPATVLDTIRRRFDDTTRR